ncbi:hypothetical protein HPP92_028029 [Vanilla planifolia]|uniref:Uncharacterized protein n=1 Tax=Vanilla planifolia TaxID=51239 RepID=A0A835P8Y3_VANPL|nr:hypothetical protein HPP92_028029 [Vanilla planifolia]
MAAAGGLASPPQYSSFLLLKELDQLRHEYYRPLLSTVRPFNLPPLNPSLFPIFFSCPFHFPFPSLPRLDFTQTSSAALLCRLDIRLAKTLTSFRRIKLTKIALAIGLVVVTASAPALGISTLPCTHSWRPSQSPPYLRNGGSVELVARVGDEVEHTTGLLSLCREGEWEVGRRMEVEMARQIWRNDEGFRQQLYELEEHLYLCFFTINKSRNLVKELLGD